MQGFNCSATSSRTIETSPCMPNPPLDINTALQVLLKDTDISILCSKTRHQVPENNESSPLYRQPHRKLEVLDVNGEEAGITKAELVVEDEAKDLFPRSKRMSPVASFWQSGYQKGLRDIEVEWSHDSEVYHTAISTLKRQSKLYVSPLSPPLYSHPPHSPYQHAPPSLHLPNTPH
jgi:hypothetical protein